VGSAALTGGAIGGPLGRFDERGRTVVARGAGWTAWIEVGWTGRVAPAAGTGRPDAASGAWYGAAP
jgi:hypothetical protein